MFFDNKEILLERFDSENSDKKALQGDKIETPLFITENNIKIDYGFYITNQIMKPIQQLFALVLEDMDDFVTKRGISMKSWKAEITMDFNC